VSQIDEKLIVEACNLKLSNRRDSTSSSEMLQYVINEYVVD